ncbi:dynein regulatory complex protein 1 isoform X1 [Parasteatoda tepidariorum]|uniref:dynein regulatory complex protein 1 isoform X1 n=1 Tax=Parasteatoda tepidariorum TaxID=114398 RepID=UPI0039BD3FCE
MDVEDVFEEEKQKWEAKMVKIFEDLYPFQHAITHGYESKQVSDVKTCDDDEKTQTENDVAVIFEKLSSTHGADKVAEEEFHKVLADIDVSTVSPHLLEFLEDRKKECLEVFQQFDEIVGLCEEYFHLEYEICTKREKEQMLLQKSMMEEIERYLSEVEKAGDQEIDNLKDSISNYVTDVGKTWSRKIDATYEDIDKKSLRMDLCNERVEAITSKDLRNAFLADQIETAILWKKAYEDLMMLSTELEKYRYNYTKTKSDMERSIYWMQRNYRDNMPELTKFQNHVSFLESRKTELSEELQSLTEEIRKEEIRGRDTKRQYANKIVVMQDIKRQATLRAVSKHKNVFEAKQCEISDLLSEILEGDQFIFEEILHLPWTPPESTVSEDKNGAENESLEEVDSLISIKTLNNDKFGDAFRLLMSSKDFEAVLNHIAEELGFMLDFQWVNYAKKTLDIKNEIKWIELFKVFKIDFEEDLKDLKNHMMKFTKMNDAGEAVFDWSRTLEGFIDFITVKKHRFSKTQLKEMEEESPKNENIDWNSIQASIPKIHLWDSVILLLKKYKDFLTSRQRLNAQKVEVETENTELDKLLANYYSYDIPN